MAPTLSNLLSLTFLAVAATAQSTVAGPIKDYLFSAGAQETTLTEWDGGAGAPFDAILRSFNPVIEKAEEAKTAISAANVFDQVSQQIFIKQDSFNIASSSVRISDLLVSHSEAIKKFGRAADILPKIALEKAATLSILSAAIDNSDHSIDFLSKVWPKLTETTTAFDYALAAFT